MTVQEWSETGDRLQMDDHYVFYQESGFGEVLLCLHGFIMSSYEWKFIWPELSQSYRLIAPDFIGFGNSSKPQGYIPSTKHLVKQILLVLEALKIDEVHILARSFSLGVTMELLKLKSQGQLPFNIKSISFLNGLLLDSARGRSRFQQLMLRPILGRITARLTGFRVFRRLFKGINSQHSYISDELIKEFYNLIEKNKGKENLWHLNQYYREWIAKCERWDKDLFTNKIPLQLIWGVDSSDSAWGIRQLEKYRKTKGDQYVVMLKEIGHFPHLEQPKAVVSYVQTFIDLINDATYRNS